MIPYERWVGFLARPAAWAANRERSRPHPSPSPQHHCTPLSFLFIVTSSCTPSQHVNETGKNKRKKRNQINFKQQKHNHIKLNENNANYNTKTWLVFNYTQGLKQTQYCVLTKCMITSLISNWENKYQRLFFKSKM